MREAAVIAALAVVGGTALANVGGRGNWKPDFTVEFKAPPPPDAEARAGAFAGRNSGAALKGLASEFFSMIDCDTIPGLARVKALYEGGDPAGALDAYRDFFVERLRISPPREWPDVFPRKPPQPFENAFLGTADDLMANRAVFGMIAAPLPPGITSVDQVYPFMNDRANRRGTVVIDFGEPGRANWTWQPDGYTGLGAPHLPFDRSFASAAYGRPHFFAELLARFIETREERFLEKWIAFADDVCMNWRRDCLAAGLDASHGQNNIEFFSDGVLANLFHIAREAPDEARTLPAPTLARILLRMWLEFMPDALQYGRNVSTARRLMFDAWHGMRIGLLMPEFKASRYCIREYVRILESMPALSIMPDGTDVHDSRNYNKGYPEYARAACTMMRRSPACPARVTGEWYAELHENMMLHAGFIIRELWVTGAYPHWNALSPEKWVFAGERPYLAKHIPEALAEPENARIISSVLGDGSAGAPGFTSDSFPFGGYYCIRTGWGRDDQWFYMPSTRPVSSVTAHDNNSFNLYAHGRHMLVGMGSTPVTVDGCEQMDNGAYVTYPGGCLEDPFRPLYGKINSANAYRSPLRRRWHTSGHFDLCEGEYPGPFARRGEPHTFIDDTAHRRQVLFARELGVWVVTDRLSSPRPRTYEWRWPFHCPSGDRRRDYPGFERDRIVSDAKRQAIRTQGAGEPNLSLYEFAAKAVEMTGSGCRLPSAADGRGDRMLVTCLYPRKPVLERGPGDAEAAGLEEPAEAADDLRDVAPWTGPGGACGFSGRTPEGARVVFRAAPGEGELQAGEITMTGEALLLAVAPDGRTRGIALGSTAFAVAGRRKRGVPADFEFALTGGTAAGLSCVPIHRPMDLPEILPAADCFTDELAVTITQGEPGTVIRYTLDGRDPDGASPLYRGPLTIRGTTAVKARAFREGVARAPGTSDGTQVTAVVRATFMKEKPWAPAAAGRTDPGLAYTWYDEEDGRWPISAFSLDVLRPKGSGTCAELFDTRAARTKGPCAFVYAGYLDAPTGGVYSIHAPRELITPTVHAGYDLRVYLGGMEWYPAAGAHNFGAWSVPLEQGRHAFRVVYVDRRNAEREFGGRDCGWKGGRPTLEISGPGLERQPIPARMLCR